MLNRIHIAFLVIVALTTLGWVSVTTVTTTANAKPLQIVATTTTIADFIQAIGGDEVNVICLSKANEDPHYIEAKPSFMVKVRDAELIVSVGLELEKAWLENVLKGARNPKVLSGSAGNFELGNLVQALEKPAGKVDRSQGDVHPDGNPHFYLDPKRIHDLADPLAARLAMLKPEAKATFEKNSQTFKAELNNKIAEWERRIRTTNIKSVVTYHRTLVYFLDHFQIELVNTLEPKPGLPPTASHLAQLLKSMRSKGTRCVLNENHFPLTAAERLGKEIPLIVQVVPTEAESIAKGAGLIQLYERIVKAVEACGNKEER